MHVIPNPKSEGTMELRWHINDQEGFFTLQRGANRIHIPLRTGMILTRVEAEIKVPVSEKMFFNGYQSWTHCPEHDFQSRIRGLSRTPKIAVRLALLDRFGDYHFTEYPDRKGILHGVSYCYFRDRDHYRLFASLDEHPGYTLFTYEAQSEILRIRRDCTGLAADQEEFPAFDLFLAEGSEEEVFSQWFETLEIHSTPLRIKGYSSWYNRYSNINEQSIRDDLNGARKLFDPGDLFQIDNGWETCVGDWEHPDLHKFPHGLRQTVQEIHEAGFKAGLWLAPFACSGRSVLYKEHADWLLKYREKPWKSGPNWGGFYSLDIDAPGFTKYLSGVFSRIFDEWGFDLVKLDFLYAAAPYATGDHGDPSDMPFHESRAARMIRAMTLLREFCRDRLIISCGVPLMPAFGQTDYCRIGPDMSLNWDDLPFMRMLHRERVSTRQSIDNTIFRRQLDGRAFGSDPDVFFLREKNLSLTEAEKEYLAVLNALFGSVWLTSDDLNKYAPEKIKQYRELTRLREAAANVSIDPDTRTIRYTLDGKERSVRYPHV